MLADRYDSFVGIKSGRGTNRDKLEGLRPNVKYLSPGEARSWYASNGFIQTIVDGPAEDAVREWIEIRTNRDEDSISRLIMNRLDDLHVREKLKDLVRFSRMYSEGGFLFASVNAETPQTALVLSQPMPTEFERIEFINVFGPDMVSIRDASQNPLSRDYHSRIYSVGGYEVHESRLKHLVRNYIPEYREGISVIESILDAIKGQDTALWSVSSLIYEMAVWVFKSPGVKDLSPEKLAETLENMRSVLSSQSKIAIAEDEELMRISGTDAGKGFLKELFDFIFENLAGTAAMPKSRLMGQSQGVITAGQYDLMAYYDTIAKFQEIEIRPVLYWIIDMVIRERDGAVYRALEGDVRSLDWEISFKPLWKLGPAEQADVDLKTAQAEQIYLSSGTLSPAEVKARRFGELESWDTQVFPEAMSFSPVIPE